MITLNLPEASVADVEAEVAEARLAVQVTSRECTWGKQYLMRYQRNVARLKWLERELARLQAAQAD
jgi:hypothetical protein